MRAWYGHLGANNNNNNNKNNNKRITNTAGEIIGEKSRNKTQEVKKNKQTNPDESSCLTLRLKPPF